MINFREVLETNEMIEKENLDVRTITLGINLMDCIDSDLEKLNRNIDEKICRLAKATQDETRRRSVEYAGAKTTPGRRVRRRHDTRRIAWASTI